MKMGKQGGASKYRAGTEIIKMEWEQISRFNLRYNAVFHLKSSGLASPEILFRRISASSSALLW